MAKIKGLDIEKKQESNQNDSNKLNLSGPKRSQTEEEITPNFFSLVGKENDSLWWDSGDINHVFFSKKVDKVLLNIRIQRFIASYV